MSSPRLLCVCRVAPASRRTLRTHHPSRLQSLGRYQSTKQGNVKSGFRAGRFAVYTLTTSGLVVGGALAYANYDPVFKHQADDILPGFTRWADTAADLFVDRTGNLKSPAPVGGRGSEGVTGGLESRVREGGAGRVGREETKVGDRKTDSSGTTPAVIEPSEPHGGEDIESNQTLRAEETPSNQDREPQTASMEPAAVVPEDQEREVEREGVEGEGEVRGGSGSEGVRGDTVEETVRGDGEGVIGGGVEEMVEEVRGEVERVAGEVREEKVREVQEAQMADQHLNWLKDSAQVEGKLDELVQEFVLQTAKVEEAQGGLLNTTREHSQLVREITTTAVDESVDVYETADTVHRAEEAVQTSREALKTEVEGHQSLSKSLSKLMDRAVDLGLKSKVAEVEERVRECVGRLAEGSTAVQQAEVERDLLQNYHRQAQRDREQLQRELGGELPEGDSRQEAVLVMLGRRVEVLKEKLKGLEKEHQQRLTAALDQQKASLDQLAERRLEWGLRDKEREMQQELSYQADKIHREYQSELREQLKRQTDSHNRLLTEALNTQADQLAEKWSGELELKLTEQEGHYQKQLALALSRLRGIEYVVNTIAAAGNETKRQQAMRAACDSLHTALKSASSTPDPGQHFSLQREVAALRDAASGDPFILTILESLPAVAVLSRGIQGEGGLKERFGKVKRVCRRVALVPERGGGMGTYALSYLQSLLIVSWRFVGRIARSEDEDRDLGKLDTFEVLERADACLRQGDLDLAVRYVNLLRGVPRRVARDWLRDARSYLETQQAVLLVSEYMAALNISSSSVPS